MSKSLDKFLRCQDKHCDKIIKRKVLEKTQLPTWSKAIKKCKSKKANKTEHKKCIKRHTRKLQNLIKKRNKCIEKHCKKEMKRYPVTVLL
jgi:hypothetical protein